MADTNTVPEGHGKLLDAWEPPTEAGDPIGCLATTFTFSPAFFEEECLGRFLKLESDATEDGPIYLVEREEKLAQVVCAAVLVDQHHCNGTRSLRWDLHAVRPERGILHAKISLLCWSRMVRLIIGSANLTEDGYRRNREVYGVLDFHEASEAPGQVLQEVLEYLHQTVELAVPDQESRPLQRMREFLYEVENMSRAWGATADAHVRESLRVTSLLTGPGRPDLFAQVSAVWPGSNPPHSAWVVSPFFDPPEAKENRPAATLWNILRKRGTATVNYCIETEVTSDQEQLFARAPASLRTTRPLRDSCTVEFSTLIDDLERPLHAKQMWLEDDRWVLLLIGSSNFTSSGTGVGKISNYEANLVYLFDRDRAPRGSYADLERRFPPIDLIKNSETLQFQPASDAGIDAVQETVLLPTGFISATYRGIDASHGEVILKLGDDLPSRWELFDEEEQRLNTESEWKESGAPKLYCLLWTGRPPSGLCVTWAGAGGKAWWPVNVGCSTDLPPPDDLRDLPLDVLIDVLTSARPLHEALRGYLRKKARASNSPTAGGMELDPHKRVDTSGFLLQRTRRFSWALSGLRSRLERPAPTLACLWWRVSGPVGVMSIAGALTREAKSADERVFLLAELALELIRVKPRTAPGALPVHTVRQTLQNTAHNLKALLSLPEDYRHGHLGRYVDRVYERIEKI